MAKNFNISAIISAVDKVTGPVKQISNSVNQLSKQFTTSGNSIKNNMNTIAITSGITATKINTSFNSIRFDKLKFQLHNIKSLIKDAANATNNLGNKAIGAGLTGVASGYGIVKSLDPVRAAQNARMQLGGAFAPSANITDQNKVGDEKYKMVQEIAKEFRGNASELAIVVAQMKKSGLNGDAAFWRTQIRGFVSAAQAARMKPDQQYLTNIQSSMVGGDADAIKHQGFKMHNDKKAGMYITGIDPADKEYLKKTYGKEAVSIKSTNAFWTFHNKAGNDRGGKQSDAYAKSVEGQESNFGDNLDQNTVAFWEGSGALKVYLDQLNALSEIITTLQEKITKFTKPLFDLANEWKKSTTAIILFSGGLIVFGTALKIISIGLSLARLAMLAFGGPITLIVAGILSTITVLETFRTEIQEFGKSFHEKHIQPWLNAGKAFATALWDGLKSVWTSIEQWIVEKISSITNQIKSVIPEIFGGGSNLTPAQTKPAGISDNDLPPIAPGTNTVINDLPPIAGIQSPLNNPTAKTENINNLNISVNPATGQATVQASSPTGAKTTNNVKTGKDPRTTR